MFTAGGHQTDQSTSSATLTNGFGGGFVSDAFGLLPSEPPALTLPPAFATLDAMAHMIQDWVRDDNPAAILDLERTLDTVALRQSLATLTAAELARVNVILSMAVHAYAFLMNKRTNMSPSVDQALPLLFGLWKTAFQLAGRGNTPMMTMSDAGYYNWKYKNPAMPHHIDNLRDMRNLERLVPVFNSYEDDVSNLGFVVLEAQFAGAIQAINHLIVAVNAQDIRAASQQLDSLCDIFQATNKKFLALFNLQRSSANYMDLEKWTHTYIKFVRRSYPLEGNLAGFDVSFLFLIEALLSRDNYTSRLGKELHEKLTVLPKNHLHFIAKIKQANIKQWIESVKCRELKSKFHMLYEVYAGERGFLGVHKGMALNLTVIGAEARDVTNGGSALDVSLGVTLEESRQERRMPSLANHLIFKIKSIEPICEDHKGATTFKVSMCVDTVDHHEEKAGNGSLLTQIAPGSCIRIPIQNSAAAITALMKHYPQINFDTLIDVAHHAKWKAALAKWRLQAMTTRFTLKELLRYADLTNLDLNASALTAEAIHPAPERTYSVSSTSSHAVNLIIKRQIYTNGSVGQGSLFLTSPENIHQEIVCSVLPPVRFTLPADLTRPLLLMASGNGISPYLYFLEKLAQKGMKAPINLILFTRDEQLDWIIAKLKNAMQHLNLTVYLLQSANTERCHMITSASETTIARDGIRHELIRTAVKSMQDSDAEFFIYVCGNVSFSKFVLYALQTLLGKDLLSKMISSSHVVSEAFSFSEPMNSASLAEEKRYCDAEINRHQSENSCWVTIGNQVYDITEFLSLHPGGMDLFLNKGLFNRDISGLYQIVHGHSPSAKSWLDSYRIGQRATNTVPDAPSSCPVSRQQAAGRLCPFAAMFAQPTPDNGANHEKNTRHVDHQNHPPHPTP